VSRLDLTGHWATGYSGDWTKDIDRSREQGAGHYAELLELIDMLSAT